MSWLKLLSIELANLKQLVEPNPEVDPIRDHVVGVASEELQRLYTLANQLEEASEYTKLQAKFGKDDSIKEEAAKKAYELHKKSEVIREIFWLCLNDEFELWDKPSVGVRKGFVVVYSDPKPPSFLDFLKGL
jgi:hypothetical protein